MHSPEKLSLEQIRSLVAASEGLRFESENRRQMYAWVESVLIEHSYAKLGKVARGLLHGDILHVSLLRCQHTRPQERSLFQSKDEPEGGEGRAKFGKSFLF